MSRLARCLPYLGALVLLSILAPAQDDSIGFDALVSKATDARQQNNIPLAIDLYGRALQLNPKWQDGWWFLGSLQYQSDAYASARDALTHYIGLKPDAAPALALRGLSEFEIADYGQSLNDIQRALALGAANQPRNEEILRYHEALVLTRTGNFAEALRKYRYFVERQLTHPELLLAIGLAGLRAPLLPKEVSPDQRDLYVDVGKATFLFMSGDESGSAQSFQDIFRRYPATAGIHYFYGYLVFPQDAGRAVEEFKEELKISPANAQASMMLAWGLLVQDDANDALPYAQQAVKEQPDLASEQLVLGRSLAETGNLKQGIEHLETALQIEPDNLEINIALAKAYSRFGRKEDARRERLRCLQATQSPGGEVANP